MWRKMVTKFLSSIQIFERNIDSVEAKKKLRIVLQTWKNLSRISPSDVYEVGSVNLIVKKTAWSSWQFGVSHSLT